MAKDQPVQLSLFVVYHVEVVSKRGAAYSDGAARDLLKSARVELQAAGVAATYSRSFATLNDGVPNPSIIILDIPRNQDPKKTQVNPSAFFASTDAVTITWREVTPETTLPLPEGVSDLGNTAEPNLIEEFKHAAG